MDELNYRHLLYFWAVTQEGSVTRASQKLDVAQPTISAQLKKFEQSLGARLFRRAGRTLELTETGRKVRRYAEQIFTLGDGLLAELRGGDTARPATLSVGIAGDIPASLAEPLLAAAMASSGTTALSILTGRARELLTALAVQQVDLVLATETGESCSAIRTHARLLTESPIVLAGPKEMAAPFRRGFPGSLQDAPLILPTVDVAIRTAIERWLVQHRIRPRIVAEVDDEAWQLRMCHAGRGLIATVTPRAEDRLHPVGKLAGVNLACYGITLDRHPAHPGVRAVLESRGK
jgi:LysR family transcriptional activator of nhaA